MLTEREKIDYEVLLDDAVARIARLRRRGVNQAEIAKEADLHEVEVSQVLTGKRQNKSRLQAIRATISAVESRVFFS